MPGSSCRLALLLSWLPALLAAQEVELRSEVDAPATRLLAEVLARGDYRLLDRDTVLGPETHLPGDLVVVDARVALEGRVAGSVAILGGAVFLRPQGSIGGDVGVLTGDAFLSGFATLGGGVASLPLTAAVEITSTARGYLVVVRGPPPTRLLHLPGAFGFGLPTYERVNGLSISWGAALAAADPPAASLGATLTYRGARRRLDPAVEGRLPLWEGGSLRARAGSGTRTMDAWIRGDLANSLAAWLFRSDVRDYHHSDEASLSLLVDPPRSLVPGEGFVAPYFTVRYSRDRSLEAADPWAVFRSRSTWRPNPPIDEGALASFLTGAQAGWRGTTSRLGAAASVEWAPPGWGDLEFAQVVADGEWRMEALWDHRIRVRGRSMLPLGTRPAPRQRWSFVGGSGTLPTLPTAFLRGDHLVFIHSVYLAPVPGLSLPLVGRPELRLEHAVGTAWRSGEAMPPWEQNLGVGLQGLLFHAMLHIDPAERPLRPVYSAGVELPAALGSPRF